MNQPKLSKQTYDFAQGVHHLKAAETIFKVLASERAVHTTTKSIIRGIERRLTSCINDFRMLMSKESLKIIEEELLPDEEVGKFENVKKLYLELPIEAKDYLENFITDLHKQCSDLVV